MRPRTFMVVAGEPSGDWLAAELVKELRDMLGAGPPLFTTDYQPLHASLAPRFFGAGGPLMEKAGVELLFDLTRHSVIGISEVMAKYFEFRRMLNRLRAAARQREPDAIICVDFSGFNRRLASAVRADTRKRDWFHDWQPRIIQYVSPQVWASREGRVYQMARVYDLVLSIFPFEEEWYARKAPRMKVKFIGDPMVDRYGIQRHRAAEPQIPPVLLLLPGSRPGELRRHVPVMLRALELVRNHIPEARAVMVLPNEELARQAKALGTGGSVEVQVAGLLDRLQTADAAISSTGTVTRDCAYFGVPTVALYKTSLSTYQLGKRLVKVKFLAMPNLLANEAVFPEFIQDDASPEKIAAAALGLIENRELREATLEKLSKIAASLGPPGASRRAAREILDLLG
ncbi:MAG TPA: lipid-A-disaccharide synthase [Verrucomicrobiae bacterium]|nr:lipid-A-disaccharide synthase [Verrucomicrobiae bacterium]